MRWWRSQAEAVFPQYVRSFQKIRRPIILKITPRPAEELDWSLLHNTYTLLIVASNSPGTPDNAFYDALPRWGYVRKSVCHSAGEYARDEDGDGFHEVHVNTMEGFWSLLRSWLRPHRGISQEKLPIYLGFFEFVHNVRRRGRALLGSLLDTLLQPVACPQNPI